MIIIGLTGSIGMGKSETAKMFERAGVPVFDSDAAVHSLLGRNGAAVDGVLDAFGDSAGLTGTEGIDRKILGSLVFDDNDALKKLESILHPLVIKRRQDFIHKAQIQGHDMVVIDVPLLFETGGDKYCDYCVVVSASQDIQRQRVLTRPHMTVQKFEAIQAKQMPDDEKRERADFIIRTDQGLDNAERHVHNIIEQIRSKE